MAGEADTVVGVWKKRIAAAVRLYDDWEKCNRVKECYNYWRGEQLENEFDENNQRRIQINKIHPEVRNNIPSLYYYRPFARLTPTPEKADDPGTQIEQDTQLLQDTANFLIRDESVQFREATYIALKEAHWSYGCVEVGYSADFIEAPSAEKPPLKEKKDTKVGPKPKPEEGTGYNSPDPEMGMTAPNMGNGMMEGGNMPPTVPPMTPGVPPDEMGMGMAPVNPDLEELQNELDDLRGQLKKERFFVKHIPSNRVLVATSDMPILANNHWIGYWEDLPLEDVKRCPAYKNMQDLKANTGQKDDSEKSSADKATEAEGDIDKIRLYKIWDLRTFQRIVLAEGHDKELLRKPFKRCPLKFLRFDVDPYHFYPRPLLLSKLGPQDEYNDSREYLRKIRKGTVPRYTYDDDAISSKDMKKLESGAMGTYVPRKPGTTNPIEPIQQPNFSENAIQTLTLSDKEFADVGGVGGDAKVAQTKTATQAKIAETKSQVQDSFDRLLVAEWLSGVVKELLSLAIENMSVDKVIALNLASDSQFAMEIGSQIAQSYKRINADVLSAAEAGIEWDVIIDLESLSPVSEEEKFQKWMQGLTLFGNPVLSRFFSVSPDMLKMTLQLLGIKSGRQIAMIQDAMVKVVQMEAQLAAQGQNAAPGMSPQAGSPNPGQPKPQPGGPQPGGPAGPGASVPKPPMGGVNG